MTSEYSAKLAKLTRIGLDNDVETIVLRKQGSLSWLFGGRSNVPNTLDAACFDAVIRDGEVTIITNRIEAPRLQDTELAGFELNWQIIDWWQGRPGQLPTGAGVGSDLPYADAIDLSEPIAQQRRSLDALQVAQLRGVAADTAAAMTQAAQLLTPELTEYEAAGVLAHSMMGLEIDPVVLMVAGARRMPLHRHPLPTSELLGNRVMLVTCGRRDGLIASSTRIVTFAPVSKEERARYDAILEVEADFLDNTRVGLPIGEIFAESVKSYARNGFAPLEWHRHHQGGFSGWESREFPANPASPQLVPENTVIAWNPSGDGWKVEDTTLVTSDGAEVLDLDGVWPTLEVRGRQRPDLLELA